MRSLALPTLIAVIAVFGLCELAVAQCTTVGASCNDGRYCTVNDRCSSALACVGSARDCRDGDQCTEDNCNESADRCEHPPRASGTACSDGQFCTDGDQCDGMGNCLSGAARDCDDGRDCTTDSCDESGDRCDNPVTNGCQIRGRCVAEGEAEVGDPCSQCVPGIATNRFSGAPVGASCGVDACSGGSFTPAPTCDAAGACNPSAPSACPSGACDTRGCAECVTDAHCAISRYCGTDMQCADGQPAGGECDRNRQCATGFCVDGFCCTTGCAGPCTGCALSGSEGICTAHPPDTDPENDCASTCDGRGVCRGTDGGVRMDGAVGSTEAGMPIDAAAEPRRDAGLVAHGSGLFSCGVGVGPSDVPTGALALLLFIACCGRGWRARSRRCRRRRRSCRYGSA